MEAAAKVNAQILQTDPQDPQALIREGEIQRQKGDYEGALTTFKKAEAQLSNDKDPELIYNEAYTYAGLGRFDESIKAVKQLLALTASADGKYADDAQRNRAALLQLLGTVARQSGNTDVAIDAYQQMRSLGGRLRSARVGRAGGHLSRGSSMGKGFAGGSGCGQGNALQS